LLGCGFWITGHGIEVYRESAEEDAEYAMTGHASLCHGVLIDDPATLALRTFFLAVAGVYSI
jgi:hypothetical protein